eukprot:242687_1
MAAYLRIWICSILLHVLCSLDPETTCNNQGIVYRDSNFTACNCFDCFYGDHCEFELNTCIVNADAGNPLIFNEYWQNQSQSAIIDPYYRTGYQDGSILYPPSSVPISKQDGINYYLRDAILSLHRAVGNVNTDNKYIVIGNGCTQLINALIYAFSKIENQVLTVFAQTPYYQQYKDYAQFNPSLSQWNASYFQHENKDLIEFVTIPNNPTGTMNKRYYMKNKYTVYDMVYNWPSVALNMTDNVDFDYMLFSMSKLTGHAGTRIGWAFVRNVTVAQYMTQFIRIMNILPSIDAMYRTLLILQQLYGSQRAFFKSIRSVMQSRWDVIESMFNAQDRYDLLSVYGGFYLWIRSNDSTVDLCDVLMQYQIQGYAADSFGATNDYCRLEIVQYTPVFNIFVRRLKVFLDIV